jgi:hypothetical protein
MQITRNSLETGTPTRGARPSISWRALAYASAGMRWLLLSEASFGLVAPRAPRQAAQFFGESPDC